MTVEDILSHLREVLAKRSFAHMGTDNSKTQEQIGVMLNTLTQFAAYRQHALWAQARELLYCDELGPLESGNLVLRMCFRKAKVDDKKALLCEREAAFSAWDTLCRKIEEDTPQ